MAVIGTWAALMNHEMADQQCWEGYGDHQFIWIITAPMFGVLLVSLS